MKSRKPSTLPRIAAALAAAVAATLIAASAANTLGMRRAEAGRSLLKKGKTPQALQTLDTALAAFPDIPSALDLKARALVELGRREEAVRALERSIEVSFEPVSSLRLLGQLKAQSPEGREEGLAILLRAAALDPPPLNEAPLLWYLTGDLALKCGRPADGLSAFRHSQEAGLSAPQLRQGIAKARAALGMGLAADSGADF
jgi:tetratricopeptide (TPR) repeat protein